MLNLQYRIELLLKLAGYIRENPPDWQAAVRKAEEANAWFIRAFVDRAAQNIASNFLEKKELDRIAEKYLVSGDPAQPFKVGIVMAGNIPLVGFHDWLCVFLSGHHAVLKLSSKDPFLLKHLLNKLIEWEPAASQYFSYAELLKGCDAYIATGSDNSARYFEFYFKSYPSIIRKNRSSVALLTGQETSEELSALAEDIHLYFGLGCRNITKLFVPTGYDFVPLLQAMKQYSYFSDHHKYKNNYDYQLAIALLNNQPYMTDGSTLLIESTEIFSPISLLHYAYYSDKEAVVQALRNNNSVQCIVGQDLLPFGQAQCPGWEDFADGIDTMAFLQQLNKH